MTVWALPYDKRHCSPLTHRHKAIGTISLRVTGNFVVQAWDLPELVERVRTVVVEHAMVMAWSQPDVPIDHINLCLPCTFFMLRSVR
jgi:hypothetical protein